MPGVIDVIGLAAPVALIMRPWVGVLATAQPGMGENVRVTARNASTSLWRRVVMLPPIEGGVAKALSASELFAAALDKEGSSTSEARLDALFTLNVLERLTQRARIVWSGVGWDGSPPSSQRSVD
ncbi:hypothetical protein MMSR116_17725 [Methylobacterium mesophilicum SR1.6/6]|uniref:Uncharacterized protein n=1 Tax=Methylobacterium mesophilicum SR1.6/6 TaxID=908290 RepID=A0A6B9FLN4_9HYPH|nr:hypothetical protein [Methylobacterium mesophilicum]QGY03521.1 hypothetical protein MMSR116_17725 [Methylobacterium mesophilicum SR1.6/6]